VRPALGLLTIAVLVGCSAGESPSSAAPAATPPSATAPSVTEPSVTWSPSTDVPASTVTAETAPASTVTASTVTASGAMDVIVTDGEVVDRGRDRRIPYRMYSPSGGPAPAPVIIVSHGGTGSETGWTRGGHLGSSFAQGGFVAVHVGHLPSTAGRRQLDDRPADVSFVLDRLADGTIAPPAGPAVDLDRVGHTGHSFGAYTSHALGGATYATTHTDERIDAIAPISPQGAGQFGAFDDGGTVNTWHTVTIPSYNLVGGDEVDSNVVGTIVEPGWRLTPFERYPGTSDTFLSVVADQDHDEMWNSGSDEVERFVAQAILQFFSVYVAEDGTGDACTIGAVDDGQRVEVTTTRRAGAVDSRLDGCG
jgi:hypothetical protein